ncbi:hypothetical protein [Stenotrophomonas sp. Iso1]|uniref:hypothetical protein n=1 Tax=Stenotrophomonas sp. Iso1 TaxID=2977283 RepID=UPI0022B77A83|nr:hypothetical protein [Stenotrophomonas sp. Iso1]
MKALALFFMALSMSACDQGKDLACANFLSALAQEDVRNIDLLKQSKYPVEASIHAALMKHRLGVPCRSLESVQGEFPVAMGRARQAWVLFVSENELEHQGETLEGVSGTLVFYASNGVPVRQYKNAVTLFGFEGFGISRSATVSSSGVDVCDQEFEIFEYADNGDVIGMLAEPQRGACKGSLR